MISAICAGTALACLLGIAYFTTIGNIEMGLALGIVTAAMAAIILARGGK